MARAFAYLLEGLQVAENLLKHLRRAVNGAVHLGDQGARVGAVQIILRHFLQLLDLQAVVVMRVRLHHRLRLRLHFLSLRNGVNIVQDWEVHRGRRATVATALLVFAFR